MTRIAGAAAGLFGGLALGKALFVDPIKQAGDFQRSLNVLWANAEHGKSTLKEVSDLAIKLGADVHLPAVSASDAADAMLNLAKAGFSVKQSMDAAKGTLLLSTAAEVDGATAAKVVTQNLNAFGLKAKDTSAIVDQMAGFLRSTGTDFAAFTDSLTYVAGPAHAVGQSFKETSAQLAILSQKGYEGSQAGTGLRQTLTRLSLPAGKAHDAFKALGISTVDASGNFIGIRSVIEQLQPKLAKMTPGDRNELWKDAFGVNAMNQARALLTDTPQQYDKMVGAVGKVGQAQLLATSMTKGFMGSLSGLKSTFETIQLQVGLKLLPVLTQFTRWMTAELPVAAAAAGTAFTAVGTAIGQIVDAIRPHMDQLRSVFDGVIATVQQFASFLSNNVGNVHEFGIAIGIAATAFIALTTAAKAYAVVQAAIDVLLTANPIGLIILSIAALVAGFVLLYQRSETVRQVTNQLWTDLQAKAQPVIAWITSTGIPGVVSVFHTLEAALDTLRAHWDQIWAVFGPLVKAQFEIVKTVVVAGLKIVSDAVQIFVNLLHGKWGDAWGNLKDLVSTALGAVASIVGSTLRGLVDTATATAKLIGKGIVAGIKSAVGGLAGLAGDLAGKIQAAAGQAAGSAFAYMRQVGFAIADGVLSGVGNITSRIVSSVGDAAKGAVGGILSAIGAKSPSRLFADTVGAAIGDGVAKGVEEHLATLGTKMGASLSGLAATMTTKIQPLVDQIAGAAPAAAAKLTSAAKALEGPVAQAFGRWLETAKKNVDAQFALIQTNLDANLAKAKAAIDVWKAKLTPTEALLAAQAAQAAEAQVNLAVQAASKALDDLKAKQAKDWADLLATQAKNMAALKASVQATATTAFIAEHEVNKDLAGSQGDPLATNLLYAHQSLDNIIALFNQGQATQAQLLAAQDEYDAAVLAASGDTNAQKLDSDYVTWQGLVAQQAAGSASIIAQQQADAAARLALQQQFGTDKQTAVDAMNQALYAQQQFAEQQLATSERADRDRRAGELNAALVARYNRIKTHLDNVVSATNANFAELGRMATKSGGDIGQNLAAAMRAAIPAVNSAAAALAQTVSRYLKTNSPTEAGPMSDLDKWWDALAPTLLASLDDSSIKAALSNAVTPIPGGAIGSSAQQTVKLDERVSQDLRDLVTYLKQNAGSTSPTRTGDVNVVVVPTTNAEVYRSRR